MSVQQSLRRHRIWFAVALAFGAALALAIWAGQGRTAYPAPLDPRNPGPDGGRAIARVLADQGVDVTIARGADQLRDAGPGADSVVVVTSAGSLAPSTAARLLTDAAEARIVVVQPSYAALTAVSPGSTAYEAESPEVEAACTTDQEGRLPELTGLLLHVDAADAYPTAGCFPVGGGAHLLTPVEGDGDVWLFGAGEALTNDQVLRGDNAAIALRLLGERDRLVWYLPDRADARADEAVSLRSLLPDWIGPSFTLLLISGAGLVLWRGRRLGRLSVEPLPVVVRAVETTRSRGRMYRRSGDRAHAARALRTAGRARLADRFAISRSAVDTSDFATLVRSIAEQTGRSEQELAALLGPGAPPPTTDHELVRLAQDLSRLETQLHREVRPR